MIVRGTELSIKYLPLRLIQVSKYEVRFPETLNAYIKTLIEHPECDPEPLHVRPSGTHGGLYELENGYHRYCAAIMTGRRDVACIVEEESTCHPTQP